MHSETSINARRLVLMASVKDAPFKCTACKKIFISDSYLRRHEERRHDLKSLHLLSHQGKQKDSANADNHSSTITALLHATERIEDLLVKLTVKETEKLYNGPLECSSINIVQDNSFYALSSSSNEKNLASDINHIKTSNDGLSNDKLKLEPKSINDQFLEEKENEALLRVSFSLEESNSKQALNSNVNVVNEQQDEGIIKVTSSPEVSFPNEMSSTCNSRSKDSVIGKLIKKLESYGINPHQETLSDSEASRIGRLLKYERNQIAEKMPEYYKLRELIIDNAERRIQENLLCQNTNVYTA